MNTLALYHEPTGGIVRLSFADRQILIDQAPPELIPDLHKAISTPIPARTGGLVNGGLVTRAIWLEPGTQEHFDELGMASQIIALGLYVMRGGD